MMRLMAFLFSPFVAFKILILEKLESRMQVMKSVLKSQATYTILFDAFIPVILIPELPPLVFTDKNE